MNLQMSAWVHKCLYGSVHVGNLSDTLPWAYTHPMSSQQPRSLTFPTVKGAPAFLPTVLCGWEGSVVRGPSVSFQRQAHSPSPTSQPPRPQSPTPSQLSWLPSTVTLAFLAGIKGTVVSHPHIISLLGQVTAMGLEAHRPGFKSSAGHKLCDLGWLTSPFWASAHSIRECPSGSFSPSRLLSQDPLSSAPAAPSLTIP